MSNVSRRSFLQAAAGLIVAISLPRSADASEATVAADSVDGYLAISPSGSVTVFAARSTDLALERTMFARGDGAADAVALVNASVPKIIAARICFMR